MWLEKLFRKGNSIASKYGSREQQDDIAGLTAATSQSAHELEDIKSGTRRQDDHPHHQVDDLNVAVQNGISAIFEVLREILKV